MKLIIPFFKLIRWPNLMFIVLTQTLFFFCILQPALVTNNYPYQHAGLTQPLFILIVVASTLIAAAGYIINDYFDINIDQINKPNKMIIEKIINRRWAILLHFIITTAGVIISFYVSEKTNWIVLVGNIIATLLLWVYSTTFKKKLLSGNIIIAALTAWTILILYFAANNYNLKIGTLHPRVFKFAVIYAGFAFIISLIREVVKDMEDIEGDALYGCKTMPIVWGISTAKVFVAVWLIVLIAILIIIQLYVLQLGKWWSVLYCTCLVIIPLILILKKIWIAQSSNDYHKLSSFIKLIMLSGILSMLFFK